MKNVVLKFGLISGTILAVMTAAIAPLYKAGVVDFDGLEVIGYSSMILAFLMVFFGIRSYRENAGNGVISFGRAFKVGILITLIACAGYVVSWELVYYNFFPDFVDQYSAHTLERLRTDGATKATILTETKKMDDFKELYANPFVNVGITFLEVFPIGLIVTLVSSAILRKKHPSGMPDSVIA